MKLTKLQQLLIGLGFVLLANGLVFMVISQGARDRIESADTQQKEAQANITNAKRIQKAATELQEQMVQLNVQLEGLKKILPLEINFPRFLADLKRIANENGLEVRGVSSNEPVVNDVIVEHPITVLTLGGYHDYGYFFAALTNYPRILNIKSLQMVRDEKAMSSNLVTGSFVVSLFTYREPTEEELKTQFESLKKGNSKKK